MTNQRKLKKLSKNNINVVSGLYYCNENEALYLEILETVLEESIEKKAFLDKGAAAFDWKGYYREAHALRNVTATIGADNFHAFLNDLCAEMKQSETFPLPAKVNELMKRYDNLLKIIKNSIKS